MKNYHNYEPTEHKMELASKTHQEYLSNPDELIEISNEVSQYFPQPVSDTRLVLMEIDPYKVYAYWNINENDLAHIQKKLGKSLKDAQLVLRMYDISCIYYDGTNAHSHFDMVVQGLRNNWYIDLWSAAKSYCADLGFRLPSDDFHAITHSNIIHTPRDSQSPFFEQKGLLVAEDAVDIQKFDDLNTSIEAHSEKISPPSMSMPDSECVEAIKNYYEKLLGLDEKEPKIESKATTEETPTEVLYKEKAAPDLAEKEYAPPGLQELFFEEKAQHEEMQKLNGLQTPPEAQGKEVSPPAMDTPMNECMEAIENYYEKILGLDEKDQEAENKAEDEAEKLTKSVYKEEYISTHLVGEEDSLVNNQLSEDTLKEMEAEIYIRGRAKPGTTINLGGQIVTVGSDGTFSVRHPLSHEAVTSLLGTSLNDQRNAENSKCETKDPKLQRRDQNDHSRHNN